MSDGNQYSSNFVLPSSSLVDYYSLLSSNIPSITPYTFSSTVQAYTTPQAAGSGSQFCRFNFGVAGGTFKKGMSRRQSFAGGNERVDAVD